jgi:stage V sporulation protein R
MGIEECFFAREVHSDESAIRCYLDIDDFRDLNLFSYSTKRDKVTIDEVSDDQGWRKVRDDMIANIGVNSMPIVQVKDLRKDGTLVLSHIHDGRDLNLEYAEEVVNKIKKLWPNEVKFFTIIEEESWEI